MGGAAPGLSFYMTFDAPMFSKCVFILIIGPPHPHPLLLSSVALRIQVQLESCRVEPRINDPVMAPCFYATYAFYK